MIHRRRCDRRAVPDVTVNGSIVTWRCPGCGATFQATESLNGRKPPRV